MEQPKLEGQSKERVLNVQNAEIVLCKIKRDYFEYGKLHG